MNSRTRITIVVLMSLSALGAGLVSTIGTIGNNQITETIASSSFSDARTINVSRSEDLLGDGTTITDTRTGNGLLAYCPIEKRAGRLILDFTDGGNRTVDDLVLVANIDVSQASTRIEESFIPAGTYEVRYASHDADTTERTSKESWRAVLLDEYGVEVVRTPPFGDIPDWWFGKPYPGRLTTSLIISRDSTKVWGIHTHHRETAAHSVVPLCISFERVGTQ